MSLPIFPALRYYGWAVKKSPQWSNITQRSPSGGALSILLYPYNPLWKWEWSYEVLKDQGPNTLNNPVPNLPFTGSPFNNTLFTDLQVLEAFFNYNKGSGLEFVYQPPDSVVVGQQLADPDANGNVELVHTMGGFPNVNTMTPVMESVQELNGGSITLHQTGGTLGTTFGPGTTPPYEGIVLHFSVNPNPGSITADYTYFYRVKFSKDIVDFEQFTYNLWQLRTLEFEQIRITAT